MVDLVRPAALLLHVSLAWSAGLPLPQRWLNLANTGPPPIALGTWFISGDGGFLDKPWGDGKASE